MGEKEGAEERERWNGDVEEKKKGAEERDGKGKRVGVMVSHTWRKGQARAKREHALFALKQRSLQIRVHLIPAPNISVSQGRVREEGLEENLAIIAKGSGR